VTRARALAWAGAGTCAGAAVAALLAAWLAPGNVLALWRLVAFCG
jgi:hypothetical protein